MRFPVLTAMLFLQTGSKHYLLKLKQNLWINGGSEKIVRAYVYYMQGGQKYYDGNTEEAIKDFDQAIELNPDDAETYKFRAKAKAKLDDNQAAIDDYNQAIKLNPGNAEIYKDRAKAKSDVGDHIGAVEDYNQAIKINPDDAEVYKKRGEAKQKLGDITGGD